MPLPDLLPIQPFTRPVRGEVSLPGSKSLTNRALLLAALCDGPVTLTGALFSEDTRIMAEALRRLGFQVVDDSAARTIRVVGQGGRIPAERAELFVGNAGTAARFLTALCAAAPRGAYRLDGVPAMRKRPMKGLIEALRAQGAEIHCLGKEPFLPIEIRARGLAGGLVAIDASESSQMLSALLMVAPLARRPLAVDAGGKVRWPFVQMTLRLAALFGRFEVRTTPDDGRIWAPHGSYRSPGTYPIEADATAASYFMALPLIAGGAVQIPNLSVERSMLQGDVAFARVLRSAGAAIEDIDGSPSMRETIHRELARAPRQGIRVRSDPGSAGRGVNADFNEFSDTFLTLAAIAAVLEGPTRISGIAHTRKQETDRVAGMAAELRKLGQDVVEREDSLEIHPRPVPISDSLIEIETYDDHRFAMSFAILGCRDLRGDGRPWLAIRNPACCAKTFPNFFEVLESLRQQSLP